MLKIELRELLEIIEQSKAKLVIVEGINDKRSLENLGFTNIFHINRLPLYRVIEYLENKTEVIILTDLDCEGRKLYHALKKEFEARSVLIDDALREALFKTDLRQIEGLYTYIRNLEEKAELSREDSKK